MSSLPKVKCRGVQSFDVPRLWEKVRPYLQKGLQRGSNYSLEDIYEGLVKAEMQLWVAEDPELIAALVTSIQTANRITYCLMITVGGSRLHDWQYAMPALEEWAKDKGCTELRIYGRRGWKKLGFEAMYTVMRKPL